MRISPIVSISIGGHTEELTQVLVASCQGHALTMLGIEVHGILGQEFLSNVTLEVDYEAETLVLHDPKKYMYNGGGAMLDLEFDSSFANLPFTTAVFEAPDGTERKARMLVDSGGSVMATCGLGVKKDIQEIVPPDAMRIPVLGVTGLADDSEDAMHSSFMTRLNRMRLGPYTLERPSVSCGPTPPVNLFGAEVLRRFDVVFDYANKRLILEPNASYKDPLRQDTSGMMLVATADNANARRVQAVIPKSPAAEAGLKVGDELIRIDDVATDSQDLQSTRELFYTANQEHSLKIMRDGKTLSFKLKTREIF